MVQFLLLTQDHITGFIDRSCNIPVRPARQHRRSASALSHYFEHTIAP